MSARLLQGFLLGDLTVDPLKGEVTGADGSRHVPPKAVQVLLCLAEQPGEVVERQRILETVWGPGKGSEEALSHTVSTLRHALADQPDAPVFIQTLPRRGYRLLKEPIPTAGYVKEQVAAESKRLADLSWFENLRERGVIQASIVYILFGVALIELGDIVFGQLQLPWFGVFTTVLVIAGFPVVVLLSWFLEFRDGKAVLHELSPEAWHRRRYSRTYLSVAGALVVAALAVIFYDRRVGLPTAVEVPEFIPALPPVQENSFAVLPFKNVDGSERTRIFADGLVDDVITGLSQVPGLRVSSRGDSFTLEADTPSQRVRERLRVARYLEGSVETAGEDIRVIVQLIDSESGFHVISRRFDRSSDDYFSLRDEITSLTVSSVRVALPTDAQSASVLHGREPELDAYLLYRRGVDATWKPQTMENVEEAIRWYDAALEVDPDYAAAHAGKCSILVEARMEVDKPEMIERAQESCARARNLNPNLAVVNNALGRLYLETGQLEAAASVYERALQSDPSSEDALAGLGNVRLRQNRSAEAEEVLRRNLDLHPGNPRAHSALGTFLFLTGRYADGAEQYQYAAALEPDSMTAYLNLGTAQMAAGFFAEAIATFNKSLELEPKQVTYSNLGLLYYYLGDLESAIAAHDEAVKLEPRDYLARINRGDALWASGRERAARESYRYGRELAEEELRVNPQDPYLLMDLAWTAAMLGDLGAARLQMNRAMPLAPEDPQTHYIDGLIHLRENSLDAAAHSFARALELGYSPALLRADPHLRSLKSDARFAELVPGI
jgi:tetratricopeptide (TPR) repeat protein/DNA-binding winged helix-turn-helix (wHTH) protein